MGFFSRFFSSQPRQSLPPLVEPPAAGQLIVLDEEEQARVDRSLAQFLEVGGIKNRIFPKDLAESIENTLAAQELVDIAKSRLNAGRLREGASACLKAVCIYPKTFSAWILLGQANAEYGDQNAAKGFLDEAVRVMRGLGLRDDLEPYCSQISDIRQRLAGK